MPRQSLNPIIATGTAANPFEPVELEIFLEKLTPLDTYTSLGVFTFAADSDSEISERIDMVLHAAMMADIQKLTPKAETESFEVPEFSRKFKYRTRYFSEEAWSSWTDSDIDQLVFGGLAFEDFNGAFATQSELAPTIFKLGTQLLSPYAAPGYVYVLAHENEDVGWEFKSYEFDGTVGTTTTGTHEVSRRYAVVAIPIVPPAAGKSPFFNFKATVDGVARNTTMFFDLEARAQRYDFAYLSAAGGWAYLPCHGSMARMIEVTQQVAERNTPGNYHEQENISQFLVWDTRGNRKIELATGYMPQAFLEPVIQDFLLSPMRFMYDTTASKWLPVLVNTKSANYHEDWQTNLRSFKFEIRPAYETNLPSANR